MAGRHGAKPGSDSSKFHKNPNCRCPFCTTRRRKEEALTVSGGGGGESLDDLAKRAKQTVLNSDLPPLFAQARSARAHIAQWILLRQQEPGITDIEIAKRIGITPNTLKCTIQKAKREGWLKIEDPMLRIEHELVPKVIDNLNEFLDEKDKTVTIEMAKGTIFKQYQESKGISEAPTTVLALKIEAVHDGDAKVIEGHVVGKPRMLEEENA